MLLDQIASRTGGVGLGEVGGQIEGAAEARAAAGANGAHRDRGGDVGFADACGYRKVDPREILRVLSELGVRKVPVVSHR